MQNLQDITPKVLAPGIRARVIHGEKESLSIVDIDKGSILPEHSHPHEQITYVIEGQLDMIIGGEAFSLKAGSVHVIPSNVPHSATAPVDVRVIDCFSPVREDYR